MKTNPSSRGLLLYPALLSIWLAISCAALFYTDPQTAMAGTLILAAVSVAALSVLSGALVWGMCIITVVVYGAMINALYGVHSTTIFTFITFCAATVGTALLAWNTSKQFMAANRQVERDRTLIEEMRVNDEKTGLMRFHYARRSLSNEISRSLRYGKKISLLLIKVDRWEELAEKIGLESRENLLKDICEVLFTSCRNVDTLFVNIDKIGVILPETDGSGAEVIARRLADQVKKKTKYELRIGIAGFPEDSIVEDDLITKAEIALLDAVKIGQEISFYQTLIANPIDSGFHQEMAAEEAPPAVQSPAESDPDAHKRVQTGETALYFYGVGKISDIDTIQKALERVPEITSTRLIDFSDNEIVFAVASETDDLAEILLTKLDMPGVSIDQQANGIAVQLNPSMTPDQS